MKTWTRERMIRDVGRHIYSGPEARIQVLEVSSGDGGLWKLPAGSLLATVIEGQCLLATDDAERDLLLNEQVLLQRGERFAFRLRNAQKRAVMLCIWLPGVSGAAT